MLKRDLRSWAPVLTATLLMSCAGDPSGSGSRGQAGPGGAAGSFAGPIAGTKGGAVASTAGRSGAVDNPGGVIIPVAVAGSDAGPDAAPDSGETCVAGKFCEPKGPDGDCGSERLETSTKVIQLPGNVMVIFDRSTSMEEAWNGVPRYEAAGSAFTNAIKPLEALLRVGAIFFPSPEIETAADSLCPMGCNVANPIHWIPGAGACCLNLTGFQACGVNPIDRPDQIAFGPAPEFLTQAPMKWRFNGLIGAPAGMGGMMAAPPSIIGATPLGGGIIRAAEAIAATTFDGPLVVVILTDGQPNCDTDTNAVLMQIGAWQAQQITSYVIGLPGSQEAAAFLNQMATTGGTGMYIDPANAMELESKLRTILTTTIRAGFESCTFKLDRKTEVPEKLHLVVTEGGSERDVPRDLSADPNWGPGAGWTINAEGDTVEITGRLCELAKAGAYEGLRFDYGCVVLPPPDPPQGPS